MKTLYIVATITLMLTVFYTPSNGQDTWGSMEVLGGFGFSNASKSYQKHRIDDDERFSSFNALNYSTSFSPGLYATGELRFLANLSGPTLGVYVSYSQLQLNSTYTRSIDGSLGLQYNIFYSEYTEYIFSFGGVVQFDLLNRGNHQLQPIVTFGISSVYAERLEFQQELRYHLNEYSTTHHYQKASREEFFLKHYKYSNVSLGLKYFYQIGKISPFCELGYRYFQKSSTRFYSGHDWNVFYGKIGLRLSFYRP